MDPDYSPPDLLSAADQTRSLELARAVLDRHVRTGDSGRLEGLGVELTPALREPRAAFVTLHVNGHLRGCIGTMVAEQPLAECIRQRTVQASTHDTRFRPIEAGELASTAIEISVLTPPRPIASAGDIVIGQHGIVLHCRGYRSVLLPTVASDRGWGLQETLDVLAAKAGLTGADWQPDARYEVFEAQAFEEAAK